MGLKDSSKTRVEPVFNQLFAGSNVSGEGGGEVLRRLLALPSRFDGRQPMRPEPGLLLEKAWGKKERLLRPPNSLLEWLVMNPSALRAPADRTKEGAKTRERRDRLLAGDAETQENALHELRKRAAKGKPPPAKGWRVFETFTHVDAFLLSERAAVLVEGKRTESGPTLDTDWMPVRHQLLRNLDCGLEAFKGRSVLAFFIVEGEPPNPLVVPPRWREFSNLTTAPEALAQSLPHRSEEERGALADGYLGVTTWQAVCNAFGIEFESLPDQHGRELP